MELLFVGTGVSCAVPVIGHVGLPCVCDTALRSPQDPNYRNNVSLLLTLRLPPHDTESERKEARRVLIDCGKTFRNAYFRVLAPRGVQHVDALLLTHAHADAMHCVAQLCELHSETQRIYLASHRARQQKERGSTSTLCKEEDEATTPLLEDAALDALPALGSREGRQYLATLRHIPTYLTARTLAEIERMAPQVLPASYSHKEKEALAEASNAQDEEDEEEAEGSKHAESLCAVQPTTLRIFTLPDTQPTRFHIAATAHSSVHGGSNSNDSESEDDFPMYTLPVEHGKGYISLGFVFGRGVGFVSAGASAATLRAGSCVVYISDVSAIPAASMAFLRDLVKIDVLVIDLLAEHTMHSPAHTCWDDLMPILRQLAPRRTYCVGMICSLEHHASNALWKDELRAEKQRLRTVLEQRSAVLTESEREERALAERFLREVQSIELAYDGMQLQMPL